MVQYYGSTSAEICHSGGWAFGPFSLSLYVKTKISVLVITLRENGPNAQLPDSLDIFQLMCSHNVITKISVLWGAQ